MRLKIWLLVNVIVSFLGTVSFAIVNFLLWEKNKSLDLILHFNLYLLLTLLIGCLAAGFITYFTGAKISFCLSIIFKIAALIIAAVFSQNISNYIVVIAVFLGLNYAFYFTSGSIITQLIIVPEQLVRFNSINLILATLASLASPLLINFLISSVGYVDSLKILCVAFGIIILIFLILRFKTIKQNMVLNKLLIDIFSVKRVRNIALINLGIGFAFSLTWGITDIIILTNLGSLSDWANVGLIIAISGIIISFFLRQIKFNETSKIRGLISISALIYAVVPILLINHFSKEILFAYTFANLIFTTFNGILTSTFLIKLQNVDQDAEKEKLSYRMFFDLFMNIGQLLPIIFILLLPSEIVNINTLSLVLIATSFAPLLFIFAYNINLKKVDMVASEAL